MHHEFDCPECSHETTYRSRVGGALGVFFHFYREHDELMTDVGNPLSIETPPEFDYEPVESIRELLAELFDEETKYDDILFEVETTTSTYSVEAVNFTDRADPLTGFNISEIDSKYDTERILADVDLDIVDTDHVMFVVFECDATGTDEMAAAFDTVLDGLGDDAEPVRAKRRHIENGSRLFTWLAEKLPS